MENKERIKRSIVIGDVMLSENGSPTEIRSADNSERYFFPPFLKLNALEKIQLVEFLKKGKRVEFNFIILKKPVEKGIIVTFGNLKFSALDFAPSLVPDDPIMTNLSIISLSRGLLYQNEILVTNLENVSEFFRVETKGSAKITIAENANRSQPEEIVVLLKQDFLTFNIPDGL